jgi:hypothetical protein
MDSCSGDKSEEDGGADFGLRAMARAEGLLDRLVHPPRCWATWRGLRFMMMCFGARSKKLALLLVTPFISLVGLASVAGMVALY